MKNTNMKKSQGLQRIMFFKLKERHYEIKSWLFQFIFSFSQISAKMLENPIFEIIWFPCLYILR